jgi:hypothetical protein
VETTIEIPRAFSRQLADALQCHASVAARHVWQVIVALPHVARDATLRRLGADDRLIAYLDEPDDGSLPTPEHHAALERIVARLELGIAALANAHADERAAALAEMLSWRVR